uniref:NADP-dependent oxidoreductase domain-containing protein n=1 Tax=Romanomermis culicivorax TaxID=13658 RepID=A0A915KEU3_ROMCU
DSEIPRNLLFLTSKLWPVDYGYLTSQEEYKLSCKRLNVDYLDLYLLHFPEVPHWFDSPKWTVLEETWRAMEKLYDEEDKFGDGEDRKDVLRRSYICCRFSHWMVICANQFYFSGDCKAIGVSNFDVLDLENLLDICSVKPHVNQCEFHPFYNPKPIRSYCQEENIRFTGYCPLAKGTILNESILKSIANRYEKSVAQLCLRWSVQNKVAAIPKSLKFDRLWENTQVFDFDINEIDMEIMNNLHDESRKQVSLSNLQEKFDLPAGYKLNMMNGNNNSVCSSSGICSNGKNSIFDRHLPPIPPSNCNRFTQNVHCHVKNNPRIGSVGGAWR